MPFTKVTDNLLSSGVGTGANNLIELDSSGNLPAVNGSAVTTLTSGNLTGALPAIDGANLTAIPVVTETMVHADAVNKFISGRKNLIINGGFDVWQRGTSFSGVNSDYTTDRWYTQTDGTTTAQKVEDNVNGNKVATISSVASGQTYHVLLQRIEYLRRYQGKTLTISAWLKGSAGTFTQWVEFRDSSGSPVDSTSYDVTYTGNWQYITHTFTVPSNTAYDDDLSFFNVSFYGGDALSISQVQLELGSLATDFEHRSYGEELALCQRYYETGQSVYWGIVANTHWETVHNQFSTEKRAIPTMTLTDGGNSVRFLSTIVTPIQITTSSFLDKRFENTSSSLYDSRFTTLWAADAEL